MFPSPALLQTNKKASDWAGVRRRLAQKINIGRGDTTFLARCAPLRCESERNADSTLTAEGYGEPQE